jgi:ABC-type dipeptide/oligopeptide/nickel transport system permease subunit
LCVIALTRWTQVYQIARAEVAFAKGADFALAARALGASPWRVLWYHVVPHLRRIAVVSAAFSMAQVILAEAALAFLRAGRFQDEVSWAGLLGEVRDHPEAWWLLLFPGLFVFVSVLSFHLFGERLRDALDPKE